MVDGTIAAISTARGRSAIAVLRISGPVTRDVLGRICPTLGGTLPEPRTQRLLALRHPESGELLDRALVTWFPAPASYTGEDMAEVSTHGGMLTPQLVLDAIFAAGARQALPGEFTHRALDNGKLDLLQAEAVLDMIDGSSPALHRTAVHQMERGLSRRIQDLRQTILRTEALTVYNIDFPEEDAPPVPTHTIREASEDVIRQIEELLETAPQGEMLRDGALVVLAGQPNSGKSSLFNALLGKERAIVTETPGTTRDALEADISIDGYPFRLVDTAGLRETADQIEKIGIEFAQRYLQAADLIIFCIEAGRPATIEEIDFLNALPAERTLIVRSKADDQVVHPLDSQIDVRTEIAISAHRNLGLDELRQELLSSAFGGLLARDEEAPLVTRARHVRALHRARDEVDEFMTAHSAGVPMELATTHLRDAADALHELIGIVAPDDVLGAVFGEFCVGK